MKALGFILRNLDEFRVRFILVIIAGLINSAAIFLIPVMLSEFTKREITTANITRLIVIVVGLYVVSLLTSYVVRGRGEALSRQYADHIRLKYFHKLGDLSVVRLLRRHSGYNLSLINKVSDGLSEIIFSLFWDLAPGVVTVCLFFWFIARESPALAMTNLIILVVFLLVSVALSRRMVPMAGEMNRRRAMLLEQYADFMANIVTVKKLGVRSYAEAKLRSRTARSAEQINRLQMFHARRWFLLHSLYGAAYLTTIGFLIWHIGQNKASPALLILFVAAYGLLRGLIERLSENVKSLMEMNAYLSELEKCMDEVPHSPGRGYKGWRKITFQEVNFRYNDSAPATTIPAFRLARREKVSVTGKSGQGKSTFLSLLTNFLQPQAGQRLVDDLSYEQLGQDFFDSHIAVISQEVELFNLSVRDNLTLGKDIADAKLLELLQELDLGDWFASLEHGFDSVVGEKGVRLSAGQKQRLNILRGLLLDRSLYVLDEPTAHLDATTEKVVVNFLRQHLKNKSAVIVTHRPALQELCQRTYQMKNHQLTEVV